MSVVLLSALVAGYVGYAYRWWQYDQRASAAHANMQYVAAWNMRRSGDVITVAGRITSAPPSDGRGYAWITLDGIGKSVELAGVAVPFCDGDDVAASGTYTYDTDGGVLLVSDRQNIATKYHGYADRLGRALRGLGFAWCGFN